MNIAGRSVFAVLRFEDAPREVQRLIQGVEGRRRIHVWPHGVHHLLPRGRKPRLREQEAQGREYLPADVASADFGRAESDRDSPKILDDRTSCQSSRKGSAQKPITSYLPRLPGEFSQSNDVLLVCYRIKESSCGQPAC